MDGNNVTPGTQPQQNIPEAVQQPGQQMPPQMQQPTPVEPLPPQEQSAQNNIPKTSHMKRNIFILVLLVITALFFFGGFFAYAVAYGKIHLKDKNMEYAIKKVVFSIPFFPKTPEYVILNAATAHKSVTKQSFDVSVAIDSQSLNTLLGNSSFDAAIKGVVDYTDVENLLGDITIEAKNLLNLNIRLKDKFVYFKINKLPDFLSLYVPMEDPEIKKKLEYWISYDLTPMETAAREYNEKHKEESKSITEQLIQETLTQLSDEKIMKEISLSKEKLEKNDMHVLTINMTDELIDYMHEKYQKKIEEEYKKTQNNEAPVRVNSVYDEKPMSSYFDDVKVITWIDAKTYYVRKVLFTFRYAMDTPYSSMFLPEAEDESPSMLVTVVMQFNKYGEPVKVEKPTQVMTTDEFYSFLSSYLRSPGGGVDPVGTLEKSQDTQRTRDMGTLQSILEMYISDNAQSLSFSETKIIQSTAGSDSCSSEGWLAVGLAITDGQKDLCEYANKIPRDPINGEGAYITKDGTQSGELLYKVIIEPDLSYRICTHLSSPDYLEKLSQDGSDNDWFEVYSKETVTGCDGNTNTEAQL